MPERKRQMVTGPLRELEIQTSKRVYLVPSSGKCDRKLHMGGGVPVTPAAVGLTSPRIDKGGPGDTHVAGGLGQRCTHSRWTRLWAPPAQPGCGSRKCLPAAPGVLSAAPGLRRRRGQGAGGRGGFSATHCAGLCVQNRPPPGKRSGWAAPGPILTRPRVLRAAFLCPEGAMEPVLAKRPTQKPPSLESTAGESAPEKFRLPHRLPCSSRNVLSLDAPSAPSRLRARHLAPSPPPVSQGTGRPSGCAISCTTGLQRRQQQTHPGVEGRPAAQGEARGACVQSSATLTSTLPPRPGLAPHGSHDPVSSNWGEQVSTGVGAGWGESRERGPCRRAWPTGRGPRACGGLPGPSRANTPQDS